MTELKGRMLLFSMLRTFEVTVALGVLKIAVFLASGYDLSPVLRPVLDVLWAALVVQGIVLAGWNAAAGISGMRGDRAERDYQAAVRQLARRRQEAEAAEAFAARMSPGIRAMQRAMLAGTYSVNGKRHPGSLTAVTPVSVGCAVCGVRLNVVTIRPNVAYVCSACTEEP